MLADAVAAREAFLAQLVPLVAAGDVPEFFLVVAKLQATVMLPVDLSRVEALDASGSRKGDARAHVDNLRLWRSRAVGVGDGVWLEHARRAPQCTPRARPRGMDPHLQGH